MMNIDHLVRQCDLNGQNTRWALNVDYIHCESKEHATILLSISSPNIDRF